MGNYTFKKFVAVGGAIAMLSLGALPASAAMSTCPAGTPAYFTGSTVFLQPEVTGQDIWSSPVTLYAFCGSVDPANALSNVTVTGVMASSNGTIPSLMASADGSVPGVLLQAAPFPTTVLPMAPNLTTDANGMVQFTLRARSTVQPFLAGPGGAPQWIGLQFQYGSGTGSLPSGGTFNETIFGGGSIFAQTPELDSLFLFGSGAAGLAGYAVMRLRATRRRD